MIPNPTIPTLIAPKGLDVVLTSINSILMSNLTWLTSFGRVLKVKDKDGNVKPLIYSGETNGKEYISMLPDSHLNNYSFWDIEDGEGIDWIQGVNSKNEVNFGLVFFFDFRDLYTSDYTQRSIENVKHDVIEVLRTKSIPNATISIEKVYHEANNIYKGYSHKEIQNQFLMRPYGSFKIEGVLRFWKSC